MAKANNNLQFEKPEDLVIVGLDTDHGMAHALWDERIKMDVSDDLVKSIQLYGVQHPVLVRQEEGVFLVVDGRQRVRAARVVAETQTDNAFGLKVPIILKQGEDKYVAGIMATTNEVRQDDPILVKSRKAVRLLDLMGDIDEVAMTFGRTTTTIRNWLKLAKADPAVHEAIEEGIISPSAAYELAKLDSREEQKKMLAIMREAYEQKGSADPSKDAALNAMSDNAKPLISESAVKKERTTSGERKAQPGVKRTWLKKALKSDAASDLTEEQRGVLHWIVTGEAEKGVWFDEFKWSVDSELGLDF